MKIALYVIWALFVMGAAFSCTKAVRTTKRQEQLITTWSKTQAVVTGSRQGWSDGPGNATRSIRYWPRSQFHDRRGVLYVGESDVSYRANQSLGRLLKWPTTRRTRTSPSRSLPGPIRSSAA